MPDTRERLIRCFAAVFPKLSQQQIARASPATVTAWDSVASVTLVTLIEEEFHVQIATADMDELVSFEQVLHWLENPPKRV